MTQVSDELRVVEQFPPSGSDLPAPIRAEIEGGWRNVPRDRLPGGGAG
ncbi:MAG: hypothetical protein OXI52_10375 [Caldilineaceae bacterium]|nr:hypothetical protein [Caldilineaceae bacterium]